MRLTDLSVCIVTGSTKTAMFKIRLKLFMPPGFYSKGADQCKPQIIESLNLYVIL